MSINLTIRFLGNLYDDLLFISCQLAKVILDIRAYEKVTLVTLERREEETEIWTGKSFVNGPENKSRLTQSILLKIIT